MKKALIIHVGNKYGRSIKSIDKICPDLVYFIYTEDYKKFIEKIIDESETSFDKRMCRINDFQSIMESYGKSKKIFRELKKEEYDIHVGVSNGTNAMVVGLSLASVGYDCEFSYVGSVKGGRENGEVKPGFEKVFDEFHPMKQLATIEINRAKRYFNSYQFTESLHYFNTAKESSYNPKRMDIYIKIVKLYQYWDKFENMIPYINNKNKLSDAQLGYYLQLIKNEINHDDDLNKYFYTRESDCMNQIDNNIEFLDKKISRDGFIKEGDIYYYLPDLLNNAQRRIEEGKFDDATARLYRVAELISQIRLYEIGLIEKKRLEQNKVFHVPKEDLINKNNWKSFQFISGKSDFQNYKKETVKLSLKDNYELLWCFNDKLAIKFLNDNNLDVLLSGRNNSILAHGLIPAKPEDAKKLSEKLIEYSRDAFSDLDICMENAKFPKFRDIND